MCARRYRVLGYTNTRSLITNIPSLITIHTMLLTQFTYCLSLQLVHQCDNVRPGRYRVWHHNWMKPTYYLQLIFLIRLYAIQAQTVLRQYHCTIHPHLLTSVPACAPMWQCAPEALQSLATQLNSTNLLCHHNTNTGVLIWPWTL